MLSQIFMRHDFSHCFGFSEVLFLVKTALLEALFVDSPKIQTPTPKYLKMVEKQPPKTPTPRFSTKNNPQNPPPPRFSAGGFLENGGFWGVCNGGVFQTPQNPPTPQKFLGGPPT